MTLLQGVVNTFVIFISRIIAQFVANFVSNDEESENSGFSITWPPTERNAIHLDINSEINAPPKPNKPVSSK